MLEKNKFYIVRTYVEMLHLQYFLKCPTLAIVGIYHRNFDGMFSFCGCINVPGESSPMILDYKTVGVDLLGTLLLYDTSVRVEMYPSSATEIKCLQYKD